MAGKICIVEVEQLVEIGELDPDHVHLPGIYVHRIVLNATPGKAHRTAHRRAAKEDEVMAWTRERDGARAAQELQDGFYVNLGIGLPTLVANYVPDDMEVWLQSRERPARHRPVPDRGRGRRRPDQRRQADRDHAAGLVDLRQRTIRFAMIRGGKINLAILGAMQVSEKGDLANWMIPGKMVKGMGGAMDLVAGVKRVVVLMEHVARRRTATHKILPECTLPLTGVGVVNRIITDLGVIDVTAAGLRLVEIAPGVGADELRAQDRRGLRHRLNATWPASPAANRRRGCWHSPYDPNAIG